MSKKGKNKLEKMIELFWEFDTLSTTIVCGYLISCFAKHKKV